MGYAAGKLKLINDSVDDVSQLAQKNDISDFHYLALASRTSSELANEQFLESAATCREVCVFADADFRGRAELGISAMITAAWAHYGLNAFRMARSVCDDILRWSHYRINAEQRIEVLMLLALSQARLNDRSSALRTVLQVRKSMETFGDGLDRQTVGTAAAELAALLDRADLGALIADEVARHVISVNGNLRPWTKTRLNAIDQLRPALFQHRPLHSERANHSPYDDKALPLPDQIDLDVERLLKTLGQSNLKTLDTTTDLRPG